MKTALLLIAHGSREPEANEDLHHVVEELRRRGQYAWVEAAFLELAQPDADQGALTCIRQEAERIVLVPYFLSAGVHVRRDLTTLCRGLAERHPHVVFQLAEPIGRHPLIVEIVAERARNAL